VEKKILTAASRRLGMTQHLMSEALSARLKPDSAFVLKGRGFKPRRKPR